MVIDLDNSEREVGDIERLASVLIVPLVISSWHGDI